MNAAGRTNLIFHGACRPMPALRDLTSWLELGMKLEMNEFEDWYSRYPRKVARGAARKAFNKARGVGVTLDELKDGLARYCALLKKENTPQRYIVHASTWLNQERWADEYEEEQLPMWQRSYEDWTPEEKRTAYDMLRKGFPPANLRIGIEDANRLNAEMESNVVKLRAE